MFYRPSLNDKFLFYSLPVSPLNSSTMFIYFQEKKITFNHTNKGDENKSYILEVCQNQSFDQRNRQHLSRPLPQANAYLGTPEMLLTEKVSAKKQPSSFSSNFLQMM